MSGCILHRNHQDWTKVERLFSMALQLAHAVNISLAFLCENSVSECNVRWRWTDLWSSSLSSLKSDRKSSTHAWLALISDVDCSVLTPAKPMRLLAFCLDAPVPLSAESVGRTFLATMMSGIVAASALQTNPCHDTSSIMWLIAQSFSNFLLCSNCSLTAKLGRGLLQQMLRSWSTVYKGMHYIGPPESLNRKPALQSPIAHWW